MRKLQLKLCLIFAYSLFLNSIIYLWRHPETRWEIFLVDKYGGVLLTLYSGVIITGCVLYFVYNGEYNNVVIVSSLCLLLLATITIVYLWRIVSYYYIYGSDIYNYMGMTKDILTIKHIPQGAYYPTFYPLAPVFYATICTVSDITYYSIYVYFACFNYLFISLIIYISLKRFYQIEFASKFKDNPKISPLLSGLFGLMAIPNFFGGFIFPYNETYAILLLFEIIFVIVISFSVSNHNAIYIISLPLLLALPATHPIVSLIMLLIVISAGIFNKNNIVIQKLAFTYIPIYIVWYFYYSLSGLWTLNLRGFFEGFMRYTSAKILTNYVGQTSSIVNTWQLILYTLFEIFPMLVYLIYTFLTFVILFKKKFKTSNIVSLFNIILIFSSIPYIVMSTLFYLHNPIRLVKLNPIIILIVLLSSVSIISIMSFESYSYKKYIKTATLLLLLVSILVPSLYPIVQSETKIYPSLTKTWQEALTVKFYESQGNLKYALYGIGSFTQINSYLSKDLGLINSHPVYILEKNGISHIEKNSYIFILRKDYLTYVQLYHGYRYPLSFFKSTSVYLNIIYSNYEVRIYEKGN